MANLGSPLLVLVFAASAGVIWVAGVHLASSTDALDQRLGIGSALGGLILLAIATDLPELAITISGAAHGHLELVIGNLLGGIAIQTVVLAVLDFGVRDRALTFKAASLLLVIEGAMVVTMTVLALMTSQLPASLEVVGLSPGTFVILVFWLGFLALVNRARRGLLWKAEAPGAEPGRTHTEKRAGELPRAHPARSMSAVTLIFAGAALATLVAGVAIEESGNVLAGRVGLGSGIFGATVIAAATALPEASTGLAAVRLGDNQLAISDIFGGNAVLPVLFVVADLVAGRPALASAHRSDLWLAGLGVVLTGIYITGLIMRPQRQYGRLGPDSIAVIGLYVLGIAGLIAIGG